MDPPRRISVGYSFRIDDRDDRCKIELPDPLAIDFDLESGEARSTDRNDRVDGVDAIDAWLIPEDPERIEDFVGGDVGHDDGKQWMRLWISSDDG